ncbi:MAG TPA: PAS domain-containing sensor histidine kinase [Acidimicrobiia bacterium]|nr:PAS domain-containing sensor histidine kinase [Acidimicrobiia bacterium]
MHVSTASNELDDLFYRLPVALYRTSADGEVLAANAATAELLGYGSPDELLARDHAAEFAHADPGKREEWRRQIEANGIVHDFQARLRREDSSIVWVRDTARAVYAEDGSVRFYEGVLTDISAEVSASISSSILSGVLESTTDLVVVFDEERSLRYANGAARSFLGLSEDFILTRPSFAEVLPALDWELAYGLTESRGWSGEIVIQDRYGKDSPLWAVVTRHHGRDQAMYLAAIARDLTQVKATQRRLEELVTAKDVFVATVSHELRNPLAGIMGLGEELRDRFADFSDQERHDLITLIAHQASEMTALVEDLLVAVRSDVGEVAVVPESADVIPILRELCAEQSQNIEWSVPDGTLSAWIDPQRFRQILRNLLSNAERHGGSSLRVGVSRDGNRIAVTVSDDGGGVPADDIEKIFEPYQRAEGAPIKKGSVGLGLSVARRLARLMGGDLDYVQDGDWATFRLIVPQAEELPIAAS